MLTIFNYLILLINFLCKLRFFYVFFIVYYFWMIKLIFILDPCIANIFTWLINIWVVTDILEVFLFRAYNSYWFLIFLFLQLSRFHITNIHTKISIALGWCNIWILNYQIKIWLMTLKRHSRLDGPTRLTT